MERQDEAEKIDTARDERRCGTCRGFRPESGECRMGLPTVVVGMALITPAGSDEYGHLSHEVDPDRQTVWPRPPLGADDPGCEVWAEAVRR